MQWKDSIPCDLHSEFIRYVNETVSAELMKSLAQSDESGHCIDADDLEQKLFDQAVENLVGRYKNREWPILSNTYLSLYSGDSSEPSNWICLKCGGRNMSSFETCQQCSESRAEEKSEVSTLTATETSTPLVPRGPSGRSCKDCGNENLGLSNDCDECGESQEPYKRSTWPPVREVPDKSTRESMRMKLFNLIQADLDIDDPFSSIEVSNDEFFNCLDRLKAQLMEEYLPSDPAPVSS